MNIENKITEAFEKEFNSLPEIIASAPGRINLTGEHTDYNDGFVFPMAIEKRIWVAGRKRKNNTINLISLNDIPSITVEIKNIKRQEHWSDYPVGVFNELLNSGHSLTGFDAIVYGDIPLGSGLSSSAALLVSSLYLYMGLFNISIEPVERAVLTLRAETNFVGLECGIMDQYISVLGKNDHALFIDCRSLESEIVPLHFGDCVIAIIDTKKPRDLVESKYNERCAECKKGVNILQQAGEKNIVALRDVTLDLLNKNQEKMPDNIFRRCQHVVTENERTIRSADILKQGDLKGFGKLMNDSHESLRWDYEVSCEELDVIVDIARTIDGVLGARLTGAGFGGCAIVLVNSSALDVLEKRVTGVFQQRFDYAPDIFVSKAAACAKFRKL